MYHKYHTHTTDLSPSGTQLLCKKKKKNRESLTGVRGWWEAGVGIEPERDGLPVDEGQRLLEHERGEPLQSDRLLNDLVVPHEHAVPAAGKAVAGEPAHEEEEGQQGEGQDHRPGDQEPAGAGGDEQEQGDEAQHHRGHPEPDPHPAVQLWSAERLAVAQELEGHPVEVVEAVVERVVAVVVAGRTAQTLVPLSWVGGGAETQRRCHGNNGICPFLGGASPSAESSGGHVDAQGGFISTDGKNHCNIVISLQLK